METLTAPPAVALPDPGLVEPDPVLLEAARLLRAGWGQGRYRVKPPLYLRLLGAKTRYCLWGALMAAVSRKQETYAYSTERLLKALGLSDPIGWNDEDGRTQEEVVELVERAAYGL